MFIFTKANLLVATIMIGAILIAVNSGMTRTGVIQLVALCATLATGYAYLVNLMHEARWHRVLQGLHRTATHTVFTINGTGLAPVAVDTSVLQTAVNDAVFRNQAEDFWTVRHYVLADGPVRVLMFTNGDSAVLNIKPKHGYGFRVSSVCSTSPT